MPMARIACRTWELSSKRLQRIKVKDVERMLLGDSAGMIASRGNRFPLKSRMPAEAINADPDITLA
jgi:hypothetical protein